MLAKSLKRITVALLVAGQFSALNVIAAPIVVTPGSVAKYVFLPKAATTASTSSGGGVGAAQLANNRATYQLCVTTSGAVTLPTGFTKGTIQVLAIGGGGGGGGGSGRANDSGSVKGGTGGTGSPGTATTVTIGSTTITAPGGEGGNGGQGAQLLSAGRAAGGTGGRGGTGGLGGVSMVYDNTSYGTTQAGYIGYPTDPAFIYGGYWGGSAAPVGRANVLHISQGYSNITSVEANTFPGGQHGESTAGVAYGSTASNWAASYRPGGPPNAPIGFPCTSNYSVAAQNTSSSGGFGFGGNGGTPAAIMYLFTAGAGGSGGSGYLTTAEVPYTGGSITVTIGDGGVGGGVGTSAPTGSGWGGTPGVAGAKGLVGLRFIAD